MLDKAKDKNYNFGLMKILKNEYEHIKENWFIFLVCFFAARHNIADKIFPFALVVMTGYCVVKGFSFAILFVTMAATISIRFDFVYIVMLLAVNLFFFTSQNNKETSILFYTMYTSIILIFSKTAVLLANNFSTKGLILILSEAAFVFSCIMLLNEIYIVFQNIKNKTNIKSELSKIISFKKHNTIKTSTQHSKNKSHIQDKTIPYESIMEEVASTLPHEERNVVRNTRRYRTVTGGKGRKSKLFTESVKKKIKEQLLWQNINVKFFEVIKDDENDENMLISVTLKTDKPIEEAEDAVVMIVRNLCAVKLKCVDRVSVSQNYYVLQFKNLKRIKIRTYTASAIKTGSDVSGDSYMYTKKADRYYVVLSDGMGSGESASKESTDAVEMVSRFFNTDFTEEQIIKTLNLLLMLKFDEERYVTLDMNTIDYNNKEIRFYKAGASPSYILSGRTVEKIVGKNLPIGILESFECQCFKRVIRRGDMIIVVSDGIIDSIALDEKKSLDRYLETIMTKDPQTIANLILSYAIRGQDTMVDDMTVLVTKIF